MIVRPSLFIGHQKYREKVHGKNHNNYDKNGVVNQSTKTWNNIMFRRPLVWTTQKYYIVLKERAQHVYDFDVNITFNSTRLWVINSRRKRQRDEAPIEFSGRQRQQYYEKTRSGDIFRPYVWCLSSVKDALASSYRTRTDVSIGTSFF